MQLIFSKISQTYLIGCRVGVNSFANPMKGNSEYIPFRNGAPCCRERSEGLKRSLIQMPRFHIGIQLATENFDKPRSYTRRCNWSTTTLFSCEIDRFEHLRC